MKKYIVMLLAFVMACSLIGCGKSSGKSSTNSTSANSASSATDEDAIKVGFLFPSDDTSNFVIAREDGIDEAEYALKLKDSQIITKKSVTKDSVKSDIEDLIKAGCKIIFSTHADFEDAVVAAAGDHPEIEFCQEDGSQAASCGLSNMHNYYSKIYEAYYVAGEAAGVRLNYMLNNGDISSYDGCLVGFVASEDDAENASCYNAFYLGIGKVCSQAHMYVRVVGSESVYDDDGEAAKQLVAAGCSLMATHTYTSAPAAVCAEYGIPFFGNEVGMIAENPKRAMTSVMTDWGVYYEYAIGQVINGADIDTDWCEGYSDGVVCLTQLNDEHISDGTIAKVQEVEEALRNGEVQVFDTTRFTIGGESLESLVEYNSDYSAYKSLVKDGAFLESSKVSKPSCHFMIDGIEFSTYDYLQEESSDSESTTEEQ